MYNAFNMGYCRYIYQFRIEDLSEFIKLYLITKIAQEHAFYNVINEHQNN
jgi:hypothetical protein